MGYRMKKPATIGLSALLLGFSSTAYAQQKAGERRNTEAPKERVTTERTADGQTKATLKLESGYQSSRVIHDFDGDGWCDLWAAMHPEIEHRNKKIDTDGDSLTDYEEMVLMRNASVGGPAPRHLTAAEIAECKRRVKIAREKSIAKMNERREQLIPLTQKGPQMMTVKEQRQKLLKFERVAKKKATDARQKAIKWMNDNSFTIETAQPIDLDRMDGGIPSFKASFNAGAAVQLNTNDVQPGGATGFNLTGSGFEMGIWDEGNLNHVEIAGRFVDIDGDVNGLGVINHANGVAGTMIASGLNTSARGMSTAGSLRAGDFFGDFPEITTESVNGMELSNHSYGRLTGWVAFGQTFDFGQGQGHVWFGDIAAIPPGATEFESNFFGLYTAGSQETDELIYSSPGHLQVWAAGNDRNQPQPIGNNVPFYTFQNGQVVVITGQISGDGVADNGFDTISEDQVAKNILAVGAIDQNRNISTFSGFGPTDDGRIKPDVVAKGVNVFTSFTANNTGYLSVDGTSFAAPAVTGSANLLRELRSELGRKPMLASTQKGLIIHTADDLGSAGPNYDTGWGVMDTEAAAELIDADAASDSLPHIKEVFLPDSEFIEFTVKATGTEALKVSICWTDPAGTPVPGVVLDPTNKMLVNDLDLRIIQGNSSFDPWKMNPSSPATAATTGDNDIDNVEQVLITNPTAGMEYTVRINHKGSLVNDQGNVFGQMVSIILSGNEVEEAPSFEIIELEPTGVDEYTLQFESVVGANYQLETSTDLVTFTPVGGVINAIRPRVFEPASAPVANTKRFWRNIRIDD